MGNPNSRRKTAAVSPASAEGAKRGTSPPSNDGSGLPQRTETKKADPAPSNGLRFKSHATGTLRTERWVTGEPATPTTAKAINGSPLNAASPPFIPVTPTTAPTPSKSQLPSPQSPMIASIQQVIKTMPRKDSNAQLSTPQLRLSKPVGFDVTPQRLSPGNTQLITPPDAKKSQLPVKAPHTFLTRRDTKRQDIVISANDIGHNVTRVTERYLPNGVPHRTHSSEFDASVYDFVSVANNMGDAEKEDFVAHSWVELIIELEGEEPKLTPANLALLAAQTSSGPVNSNVMDLTTQHPAIQQLGRLGTDFPSKVQNLVVTLQFPAESNLVVSATPGTKLNPFSESKPLPPSADPLGYMKTANFLLLHQLVTFLGDNFTSLIRCNVVIATPANTRTPFTVQQLHCLLPFYDLQFTGWRACWRSAIMSRAEVLRGWPRSYIDRERDRIVEAREKKMEAQKNTVFVRVSTFKGEPLKIRG